MLRFWNRSLLPLVLAVFLPALAMAQISVEISANVPPPELPVYDQPQIPGDGYVWTPGYWGWSDDYQDYYWVPGTWVLVPQPEYLWTPGYWGMQGALFLWHPGYWGPQVGFYGGVNYGYGYGGTGYEGGYWQSGHLFYNRAVNNISNVNITNVYNRTVINNATVNRVSYNGGNGLHAQPTAVQLAAAREQHIPATPAQQQHMQMALNQPALRAKQNQGHPPIAATSRPAVFSGAGVVPARQSGTMSVVHQNAAPRDTSPQRSLAPRNAAPRSEPTPPPPPPPVETRRIPEERRAPEQVQPPRSNLPPPRPSAPEVHANPPRPSAPEVHANPPRRAEPPPEQEPREH